MEELIHNQIAKYSMILEKKSPLSDRREGLSPDGPVQKMYERMQFLKSIGCF